MYLNISEIVPSAEIKSLLLSIKKLFAGDRCKARLLLALQFSLCFLAISRV